MLKTPHKQTLLEFSNKVNYYVHLNTNGKISHIETVKLIRSALDDLDKYLSIK